MILTIQDTIRRILRKCTVMYFQPIRVKIKCHHSIVLFCNSLVGEEGGIDNKRTFTLSRQHLERVAFFMEAKNLPANKSLSSVDIHYLIRLHKQ